MLGSVREAATGPLTTVLQSQGLGEMDLKGFLGETLSTVARVSQPWALGHGIWDQSQGICD
jgi:hypothetical protein